MEQVIRCIQGGVQLSSSSIQRYEICADSHCHVNENPPEQENVVFPPEYCAWRVIQRRQQQNRYRDVEALLRAPLIAAIALTITMTHGCQNVDVQPQKTQHQTMISLLPTVPTLVGKMRFTLSSIVIPPTPTLSSTFISDGKDIALWNKNEKPSLRCDSKAAALSLNCSVHPHCSCQPAENTVRCICAEVNIADVFEKVIENRLPVRRPWISFTQAKENSVTAIIPTSTTAEILIHLREEFEKTVSVVSESICKVENSIAKGCYYCPQGAEVHISCTTNGPPTMATIQCAELYFTVPCKQEGAQSTLQFSHTTARVYKQCAVTCGSVATSFEITGILQWTRTIQGSALRILAGESKMYDEIIFPDFYHIFDVMLHWYKSLALAGGFLLIAIILAYSCLWSCGPRAISVLFHIGSVVIRNRRKPCHFFDSSSAGHMLMKTRAVSKIQPKLQIKPPEEAVPPKRRKMDFTSGDSVATVQFVRKKLKKMAVKIEEQVESAKTVINVHVDELEQEIRNLRNEIKKWALQPLLNDIRALTSRMILLEAEIKNAMESLTMRQNRIERRVDSIPEILTLIKASTRSEEPKKEEKPAESSEGALAVSPNEERVRRGRKEERPNDSKKLEDELRVFQKKLTVVRHEIASANYKIDDAWKKSERDPKSLDKLRELKESRRRSREEESELLRKIDKTKERMRKSYEQKERQHGAHRDQSPRPSTSRGGV
ncbi:hypothetical protein OSTOST_03102 [Ostertagia ostertagi]